MCCLPSLLSRRSDRCKSALGYFLLVYFVAGNFALLSGLLITANKRIFRVVLTRLVAPWRSHDRLRPRCCFATGTTDRTQASFGRVGCVDRSGVYTEPNGTGNASPLSAHGDNYSARMVDLR